MTDRRIIEELKSFDADATKEYFYGYCRKAYDIYDYKYRLHDKEGMDFYSLAHDYYISLLVNNFKPLEECPCGTRLSSWMIGGFRFVVLDALKAYNKDDSMKSDTPWEDVVEYIRNVDAENDLLRQVMSLVSSYYDDPKMFDIANMFLIEGYKQKEIAEKLGITPAAVNQRYKKMMDEVITPFVIENYGRGIPMPIATGAAYELDDMKNVSMECCFSIKPRHIRRIMRRHDKITPDFISSLEPNEIFVFGSNLRGIHAGGAARIAVERFGAVMGNGVGIQGQCYAIPTMQGGVETIKPYVDEFIKYAMNNFDKNFLVTPIGCGIAGFEPEDIAPLFKEAMGLPHVYLPQSFVDVLENG